jgi:hypothetical protein
VGARPAVQFQQLLAVHAGPATAVQHRMKVLARHDGAVCDM